MSLRLSSRNVLVGLTIGTLLAFQNCAQPTSDGSAEQSSFADGLPLAYDNKLDTIAHMSCGDFKTSYEPRAYFTFRAGAYTSKGGLTLTPEFINATKFYNSTQRANVLRDGARNAFTRLTLSIRPSTNYQSVYAYKDINAGEDIEAMTPSLDIPSISGPLSTLTDGATRMHYFPSSETQRLIEGSLRFMAGEDMVKKTRNQLADKSLLLIAGYSNSMDELDPTLRGETAGNVKSVYGSGFQLKFQDPNKFVSGANGENRVIATTTDAITEFDLRTGAKRANASQWDCSSNYQFMIVRDVDRTRATNPVTCNAWADRYNGETERAILAVMRRVLRAEDWFIDVANRCIIPRGPSGPAGDTCYGGNMGSRTVTYTGTSCKNDATTYCPHFVSVCIAK